MLVESALQDMRRGHRVLVTHGHMLRCIVALYMVGRCSIWSIVELLPILFPGIKGGSFGSVQRTLVDAAEHAARLNTSADLGGIETAALDEMFSQGDPVLAGVDLDSGFIFALDRRDRRTTDDGRQVLEAGRQQGLELSTVVRDGGASIADGVKLVFPDAEQRDDVLHAMMALTKVVQKVENRAYSAIGRVDMLTAQLTSARAVREPRPLCVRKLADELRSASQRCELLMTEHAELEAIARRLQRVLDVVDTDASRLRDAAEMKAEVEAIAATLIASTRRETRKAGKYLKRRADGLTRYAAAMTADFEALAAAHGSETVVLAAVMHRLHERSQRSRSRAQRQAHQRHLAAAYVRIRQGGLPAESAREVLEEVGLLLRRAHRASSAVESVNAALRTHLTIRKRTTHRFLQLYMAHANLRTRRWGRFKGTSAWSLLHGKPAGDWLTQLGFPASA